MLSKLSDDEVMSIYTSKSDVSTLAAKYKLSRSYIKNIVAGRVRLIQKLVQSGRIQSKTQAVYL